MFQKIGLTTSLSLGLSMMALATVSTGAQAAGHAAAPAKKAVVEGKALLTSPKGRTLYTFDKDVKNVSNCNGGCAKKWPPLKAKAKGMMKGDFTVISRKDGGLQWAYKGKPLYTWIKDTKAGQTSGDGVKGVWHVARPN